MVSEKVSGFRQAMGSTSKAQESGSSVFCSTGGGLNPSMTTQKGEFGRTGGRREQLWCLEQLGRKGEERKESHVSPATVRVSIAHREIPVLNCSSSKSAHNLFSALVRRHNHLPCRHERAL